MKRKIISLCLFLVTLLFLLSSCFFFKKTYFCNIDEVESIQIIRLDEYIEKGYGFEYTVLCEIDDLDTFVDKLNKIEYSTVYGAPFVFDIGDIAILVNYKNGDYDRLHYKVQVLYRSGEIKHGRVFFDKEQFNALISDYLPDYNPQ